MLQKCRIFIVEDELITRQALKYIIGLEQEQFEIVGEASNGKEAQGLIEIVKPDVVISDIVMPVMDGIELTKYIRLKYPDIQVIILSSHGDFDYVKSTFKYGIVEYILKPQLEPEQLLGILNKLVKRKMIPESVYQKPCFYILGCNLQKIQGYRKSKQNFYYEAISEILNRYLREYQYEHRVQEGMLIVILNLEKEISEEQLEQLEQMGRYMENYIPGVRWALGTLFRASQEIEYEIEKFIEALEYQFYSRASEPLFYIRNEQKEVCVEFNYKQYMEKMNRGLYEEGFNILKEYMNHINSRSGMKEQELKKMIENTFYNTLNILETLEIDLTKISTKKMEMFEYISKTKNIDELKVCIAEIIEDIESLLREQKSNDNMIIQQMYHYIDEHYNETITLNSLATIFHMSYSYVSTYFSTSTTKGFNEYLNEVRINKAKELLKYSNTSISDIGEKVGYGDQSYFSKVFKKMTNYSPSDYRRKALK